jgi:hypothetical protein
MWRPSHTIVDVIERTKKQISFSGDMIGLHVRCVMQTWSILHTAPMHITYIVYAVDMRARMLLSAIFLCMLIRYPLTRYYHELSSS